MYVVIILVEITAELIAHAVHSHSRHRCPSHRGDHFAEHCTQNMPNKILRWTDLLNDSFIHTYTHSHTQSTNRLTDRLTRWHGRIPYRVQRHSRCTLQSYCRTHPHTTDNAIENETENTVKHKHAADGKLVVWCPVLTFAPHLEADTQSRVTPLSRVGSTYSIPGVYRLHTMCTQLEGSMEWEVVWERGMGMGVWECGNGGMGMGYGNEGMGMGSHRPLVACL